MLYDIFSQFVSLSIFLIILFTIGYLLPVIIAYYRRVKDAPLILILTILLGWTGFVWIGLLVWAIVGEAEGSKGVIPASQSWQSASHQNVAPSASAAAAEQLIILKDLHDKKILTDQEYETLKAEQLKRI
jgi:hypothetical protein